MTATRRPTSNTNIMVGITAEDDGSRPLLVTDTAKGSQSPSGATFVGMASAPPPPYAATVRWEARATSGIPAPSNDVVATSLAPICEDHHDAMPAVDMARVASVASYEKECRVCKDNSDAEDMIAPCQVSLNHCQCATYDVDVLIPFAVTSRA